MDRSVYREQAADPGGWRATAPCQPSQPSAISQSSPDEAGQNGNATGGAGGRPVPPDQVIVVSNVASPPTRSPATSLLAALVVLSLVALLSATVGLV